MMAQIVAALVGIGAGFSRVNECQAQHVVGGFVPTILAVVKNRRAKLAARVGYVRPLLRRHFVMIGSIVATLDSTEAQIVSSLRVRCRKWKRCLQQTIRRLPINQVLNIDAIAAIRQPYALHKSRAGRGARNFNGHAYQSALDHSNCRRIDEFARRRVDRVPKNSPGRFIRRRIVSQLQPRRSP